MPTCKTCKYWKESDFAEYPVHPDTKSWMMEVEKTTRKCRNPKLSGDSDEYGKLKDPSWAYPTASDDLGIALVTGKDFGCIHHEPKTN